MWKTGPKHCSDEVLLQYLDRELSRWAFRRAESHLNACWECRGRLAATEEALHRLAPEVAALKFPGAGRAAAAKRAFLACKPRLERGLRNERAGMRLRPWIPAAIAASVLAAAGLAVYRYRTPELPAAQAREQLAAAVRSDHRELGSGRPLRQVFLVRMEQSVPARSIEKHIEFWSDPEARYAAARWSGPEAETPPTIWQAQEVPVKPAALVLAHASGIGQLEHAFMGWLRSRRVAPLLLSEEAALFVDSGATLISIEKSGSGVRVRAVREVDGLRMTVVFEWDGPIRRVRLEKAVRGSTTPVWTLALAEERRESFDRQAFAAAFLARPRQVMPSPPGTPARLEQSVPAADVETARLQIAYLLHKRRLCVEGTIRVERAGQRLVVVGVLPDAIARAELISAIRELQVAAPVSFEIHAADAEGSRGGPVVPAAGNEVVRSLRISPALREMLGPQLDGERLSAFLTETLVTSDDMLAEAWELRRLADLRGDSSVSPAPQSLWLLEAMLRDHAGTLARKTVVCRRLLEGLLPPPPQAPAPAGAGSWKTLGMQIFDQTRAADGLIQRLFGTGSIEPSAIADTLQTLSGAFTRLEADLKQFEAVVSRDFSPRSAQVKHQAIAKDK